MSIILEISTYVLLVLCYIVNVSTFRLGVISILTRFIRMTRETNKYLWIASECLVGFEASD